MATEVILPKVDMDMATGRIARWIVKDGEQVAKGDILFEIETDKAAMEIDAPASGVLQITAPEGNADITVGTVVAWIYAAGEKPIAPVAPAPALPDAPVAVVERVEAVAIAPVVADNQVDKPRATPLARRMAHQVGLDLGQLNGSGPRGRIQRSDVEAAISQTVPSTPVPEVRSCKPREVAPVSGILHGVWLRQGHGTPVVLIHGFGAELASWRPLLPEIPSDRPVFALDLPCHGKSLDNSVDGFEDLVAQVEEALVQAGIVQAHLIGHSLGGAVAASVAAGIRIEAASLLMISPAGLGAEISSFVTQFARATEASDVAAWLRELVYDPATLADGFIRAVARERADGKLAAAQTRFVASVFGAQAQGFSIRAALGHLGCEARIVFGTEDRVIPWRQTSGLSGNIALHLFSQTGHMPHVEKRAEVGRILRQMIR